jgi:NhaA family Na+:H+ antiporter
VSGSLVDNILKYKEGPAMTEKTKRIIRKIHPKRVVDTFPEFLKDETASGKLILIATILALIAINSPLQHMYEGLWSNHLSIGIGSWILSLDVRHWINEGLMAIFFLVVGLEIKREIVHGELQDIKKIILPIGAAVGGMIVPALIYLSINHSPNVIQGWGIPIATDIAFAVAVLTLLGPRIPRSLKIFLLTLAIADDIGAIFVIALFYAEIINYWFLGLSAIILFLLWLFRKQLATKMSWFILIGVILWLTTHLSGIHASIIGAVLGLIAPVATKGSRKSVAKSLEDFFLPVSTYAVLPLFAFANAGVIISTKAFTDSSSVLVIAGIVLGLAAGKTVGIVGASWLIVKSGIASLPIGAKWLHIIGVGLIAGIGFTVSIFITELAFRGSPQLIEAAKIGIFIASIFSAVLGSVVLLSIRGRNKAKLKSL